MAYPGEFRGKPVVLAFYPADWSPVCGDQMALYNEVLKDFHDLGAELIGVSVDGAWCHAAFARHRKLHFPLLPTLSRRGCRPSLRSLPLQRWRQRVRAVCDRCGREGLLEFCFTIGVNPEPLILSALEALQNKQAVPAPTQAK